MSPRNFAAAHAGETLLAVLAERGIEYLFGNAGTDFPSIIEAFARASLDGRRVPQPVTVPHENVAVAMAHGFYLATGRPQAVMVHVNVGTANAICGLINATRENIPLLLLAGRTPITEEPGRAGGRSVYIHWGQEMFDQAGMVRELVKWDYELRDASQIEPAIDRALNLAMSEPRGPVYLTLPREILASGAGEQALHGAGFRSAPAAPAPDLAAIRQAAEWLAAAESPLLITASYGRNPADVPALVALAEAAALPCVGYRPRHLFLPSAHPMHLGFEPGAHLAGADLVLVLDCDVPWVPRLHEVNPAARIVHIAADPLFSRYPMRSFRSDLAIAGSSRAALAALARDFAARKDDARIARRRAAVATKRAALDARNRALAAAAAKAPAITPAAVLAALEAQRRPDDMIVSEVVLPLGLLEFSEPGTYFGNSPAGGRGARPEARRAGAARDLHPRRRHLHVRQSHAGAFRGRRDGPADAHRDPQQPHVGRGAPRDLERLSRRRGCEGEPRAAHLSRARAGLRDDRAGLGRLRRARRAVRGSPRRVPARAARGRGREARGGAQRAHRIQRR